MTFLQLDGAFARPHCKKILAFKQLSSLTVPSALAGAQASVSSQVHSIGILTNAEKWIVLDFNHQTATLRTSRTYELFLPANATDESLEATVMPVLKDLAAVLLSQEEALEEWVT